MPTYLLAISELAEDRIAQPFIKGSLYAPLSLGDDVDTLCGDTLAAFSHFTYVTSAGDLVHTGFQGDPHLLHTC